MSIPNGTELDARILRLLSAGEGPPRSAAVFDALAGDLFAYQYAHNAPYRRLCDAEGVSPDGLDAVARIPACPTEAFKEFDLVCFPSEDAAACFETSGTSGERPGRHWLPRLQLYETAMLASIRWYVLPDTDRVPMALLFAAPAGAPRSSLGHMLETVRTLHGMPVSAWLVTGRALDVDASLAFFHAAQDRASPVALLGTAFSFVHLCDALRERGASLALPVGSRIMETGGYKGRSREVPRDELHAWLESLLGVPQAMIVNEYGMTEMGSQFYDGTLRAALGLPGHDDRVKRPPPWVRSWVVDPSDPGVEVADGAEGILKHLDLVNRGSVACLLTGDRARRVGDGFEVLGRAEGAELRGCSLRLEELRRR